MDNDTGVLQSQKGDKQTDTGGNRHSYRIRQGFEDLFAQTGHSQQNEEYTFRENQYQRIGVGQAEADANGVNKKRVQTHTACLSQRQIGKQACYNGAHNGRNRGCDVNRAVGNTKGIRAVTKGIGEHIGVDHQNVDHGKKGGHTGYEFGFHRGIAVAELKKRSIALLL